MSAIDIQYAQMIGDARRWLDRRGYDYIEVGMPLYWTLADCLCVVSYIGLCARPDDDGDAP